MPRFVLIDQSIEHGGGHHYEYAARVLRAARAEGYTPVLATNRRYELPAGARDEWEVHPVYRYGFWEQPLKMPGWCSRIVRRGRMAGWWGRTKLRVLVSPIGLCAQHLKEGKNLLSAVLGAGFHPVVLVLAMVVGIPLALPLIVMGIILKALWSLVPVKGYVIRVARALVRLLTLPLWPILFVVRERKRLVASARGPMKRRAFGEDTLRLLKELHPGASDVMFIPTLSEVEMAGLRAAFDRSEDSRRPTWHLLFRSCVYRGREPEFAAQDEAVRGVRNIFRGFTEGLVGQRVYFYTDTDQLTAQYNRLGVVRFTTVPIPVDPAFARRSTPGNQTAQIVYAGDAREEKGFALIPGLVRDLWDHDEARFVVQVYYSSEHAEHACRLAETELDSLGPTRVTLVKKPLTGASYREFVCDADIALIAYDRENYTARSSGIFGEAAAAGIPTIVPAGSWMSLQLEPAIQAYHQRVAQTSSVMSRAESGSLKWTMSDGRVSTAVTGDTLRVGSGTRATCTLDVPAGATHVLVTFDSWTSVADGDACETGAVSDFMMIAVESREVSRGAGGEHTSDEHPIRGGATAYKELMCGDVDGRYSRLVAIAPGSGTVRVTVWPASAGSIAELTSVAIRMICGSALSSKSASKSAPISAPESTTTSASMSLGDQTLPVFACGVIFTQTEELTSCVREILDHPSHYASTACAFSKTWGPEHSPHRLVRCLLGDATVKDVFAETRLAERAGAANVDVLSMIHEIRPTASSTGPTVRVPGPATGPATSVEE